MKSEYIVIGSIENALRLANIAERCGFDIDIGEGNIAVDAKSIIGLMNLSLNKPWKISYRGNNMMLDQFIDSVRQ